ncbi:Two-component response regulator ARR8 [Hibiscus syriacus]|uniref:Two-component response regulator ARR8 n=1 Tax=Hibiscus syriacus TaxID=106335 RepID=A0A6A3AFZ7_HIBSY|nr:two-component response regulator ORR4-like isoform X1 [Hibiscus syriacus]KAE8701779.1 Two-component response regulator ARR8 [Hibiscus syriacus]
MELIDTVLDRQPQEEEIMQKQKQGEEEEEEEEEERRRFHVLAVDDSVIDRKLLEKLLKAFSCQVTCLESGEKALEYLGLLHNSTTAASSSQQHQALNVNLIMTDFSMPGTSGYDLLKRVKGSSWKDVPVVVMSSENVPSRISMCLEGGAEEFMLKPLQLSDLHKIQAHLLKSLPHP